MAMKMLRVITWVLLIASVIAFFFAVGKGAGIQAAAFALIFAGSVVRLRQLK